MSFSARGLATQPQVLGGMQSQRYKNTSSERGPPTQKEGGGGAAGSWKHKLVVIEEMMEL